MTAVPLAEPRPALSAVFGKFALTIVSSWIVGPAAVLVAHLSGWGSNAVLVAILLALSAGAPVQLLLNEFVAAGVTANTLRATRIQLGIIIVATFFAIWAALASSIKLNSDEPFKLAYATIAALTTISIWLSYKISLRYYGAVLSGAGDNRLAIYVGITPGLVTLASFLIAITARQPMLFLLGAVAPAISQIAVLALLTPNSTSLPQREQPGPKPLAWGVLVGVVSAVIAVGYATTLLRDYLAGVQVEYAALILVSLNLLGTVMISFSRASYLTSGQLLMGKMSVFAALMLVGGAALWPFSTISSALVTLIALQLLVALILSIGRALSSGRAGLGQT